MAIRSLLGLRNSIDRQELMQAGLQAFDERLRRFTDEKTVHTREEMGDRARSVQPQPRRPARHIDREPSNGVDQPATGLVLTPGNPDPAAGEVLVLERALKTLPARREIAIVYARSFLQQERHLSPSLRRLTNAHEIVRHETDHGHAGPKPLVVILDAARVLLRVAEGHPVFHDRSRTDQLLCQISRRGVISAIATFDGANSSSRPENAQNPSLTMALRVGPPLGSTS